MAAREPQRIDVQRVPTAENRRPLDTFPAYMRQLGNAVLDGHHDIKYYKAAEHPNTAVDWGRRRGYELKYVDINDDGVDDVVLYDKQGNPVVINGYALKKSEFMLRKKFHEDNRDAGERKRVGGYSGFKKSFRNDPAAAGYQATYGSNYVKLRKSPVRNPDARESLYKRFCRLLDEHLFPILRQTAENTSEGTADLITQVIPKPSIYALYYRTWLLKDLWRSENATMQNIVRAICNKYNTVEKRADAFSRALSKHAETVDQIIENEHLFESYIESCRNIDRRVTDLALLGFDIADIGNPEVPHPDDTSINANAWRAMVKETIKQESMLRKTMEGIHIFLGWEAEEVDDFIINDGDVYSL